MLREDKRTKVIEAAERQDFLALRGLTKGDTELADLAWATLVRPRVRDRAKGKSRPSDLDPLDKWALREALADVAYMRKVIKKEYGRWRGAEKIVAELAAKWRDVTLDQLRNFQKNQPTRPKKKISRLKSPI